MLELKNISKEYETKILDGLSVSIENGEIIALKGKNGVGKTTLLNIIGGLIEYEGTILYNHEIDAKIDFKKYISKVSFLSNEAFTYQYLTLIEMIGLLDHVMKKSDYQKRNEHSDQLIELLELSQYKDIMIKNLSLGTKQKISIVVNMYACPEIILLDEPFVNLDERSVNNLLRYLKTYIQETHAIMLYSTHSNDSRLDDFCTKTLYMIDSKTIQFDNE